MSMDYAGQAEAAREAYARTAAGIVADGDLSDAAKTRQLDAAWATMTSRLESLEAAYRAGLVEEEQRRRARALGPVYPADAVTAADRRAVESNYRLALIAVAGIERPERALELARLAAAGGDALTLRALLSVGRERGWRPVVEAVFQARPEDRATLAEYEQFAARGRDAAQHVHERAVFIRPIRQTVPARR